MSGSITRSVRQIKADLGSIVSADLIVRLCSAAGHAWRDRMASADAGPATMPTDLCTHCHSTNIEVRFGRSYYFKCLDCGGNTAIKNTCRGCGRLTSELRDRSPDIPWKKAAAGGRVPSDDCE